jgi:NAD(P)H-flavin reductase
MIFVNGADGKEIGHPYSPVSTLDKLGSQTYVIKIYRPHKDFPDGGKFTQALEKVNVGESLQFKGPVGYIKYNGNGEFIWLGTALPRKSKIGILVGGTGVTPGISIAAASIFGNDGCDVKMLNFNKTKGDILCQDTIDGIKSKNSKKFEYKHVLTRDPNWNGLKGRFTAEMVKDFFGPSWEPEDHVFFFICGPAAFDAHCKQVLSDMGYVKNNNFASRD